MAKGTPENVVSVRASHTDRYFKEVFEKSK